MILAANRDEFYQRPSQSAHYWKDSPEILGGRDLEQGGTWLGLNHLGNIAAITNIRNPAQNKIDAKSRGEITRSFLTSEENIEKFGEKLQIEADSYNGFNLLYGDLEKLMYFSSVDPNPQTVKPGCHGLSNASLNTPWPKVQKGTKRFAEITVAGLDVESIFTLMEDRSVAADHELPETGVGLALERMLSSKFIVSPRYGTRASTIVSFARDGEVKLIEQTYLAGGVRGERKTFAIKRKTAASN